MLVRELLPLFENVTTIVEVSESGEALREQLQLRAPSDAEYRGYAAGTTMEAGTLVVALLGPDPASHVDVATIAPALRELPVGGRALLLLGWPVPDLPYHQMLDELVAAGCQVLQVVPIDNSGNRAHCAVLAARVDRVAPLRGYLSDEPVVVDGATPDLRALLRLIGEKAFTDLLGRPLRQKLAEAGDRVAEQDQRIRQLEKELAARDATIAGVERRLAAARSDNAKLRASATYRVGRVMVAVPGRIVRGWRKRGAADSPG
ncbi:hypothetical protein [Actinoplanes regularis]|uniref:hypothetical protein n=1 Tax=Actinoplanes regularis TaxID=52697 RepID=UPI0024A56CFA|nr:hypothetical protein [Actinoplanes regularis]GLW29554.1 hypothetical protein Areg01_24940 [Actinoplanes regularis]